MKLTLNGESAELSGEGLADVLKKLGVDEPRGVAIAVDGEVVPKSEWDAVVLKEGQSVEVVRAVQGGSQ